MAAYNLGELHSFKILSGGSENTNYLVVTEKREVCADHL